MWKAFTSAVRDVLDEDAKYSSTPNSQQHHDGSGSGSGSNELHITRPQHLPSTTAAAAADSADSATMSPIQPQFPAPAAPHPSLRSASTIPSSSAAAPAASSYATARLPPLPAAAAPAEVSKPNALSSKEEEINGPPGPPSSQPAAQYKEEAGPSHSAQARPPAPGSDAVDWKARYSSLERSFLRLQSQLRDALTDQQETEAKLMATERTLEDVRFSKQQLHGELDQLKKDLQSADEDKDILSSLKEENQEMKRRFQQEVVAHQQVKKALEEEQKETNALRRKLEAVQAKASQQEEEAKFALQAQTSTLEDIERQQGMQRRHTATLAKKWSEMEADLALAKEERDNAIQRATNLETVLQGFQSEAVGTTTAMEHRLQSRERCCMGVEEERGRVVERSMYLLRKQSQDHVSRLEAMQATMENVEAECARLRQSLKLAVRKLNDLSSSEQVDRDLAKKLFIKFLTTPGQQREVLRVIAGVLAFSEEEEAQVGLRKEAKTPTPVEHMGGITGWLGKAWRFTSANHGSDDTTEAKEEGSSSQSLVDAWVSYLHEEAANVTTPGGPMPSHVAAEAAPPKAQAGQSGEAEKGKEKKGILITEL